MNSSLATKRWTLALWWARVVPKKMRLHHAQTVLLQSQPSMALVKSLHHACSAGIPLHPHSARYTHCLSWIVATAQERPDLTHKLLAYVALFPHDFGPWYGNVVDALGVTGRTRLIAEQMYLFANHATDELLIQKFNEWIQNPLFAKARIAKQLIHMGLGVISKFPTQKRQMVRTLFNSTVIKTTIPQIAEWLARKMLGSDERTLRQYCRRVRSMPEVAAALSSTTVARRLHAQDRFRASVRLAHFFRTLRKPRRIIRDACMICWKPTVLYALHDDVRHAVCGTCRVSLARNGGRRCPMCRVNL
jgi:hypothetical protein